jgi:hypothetical protein
MSRHTRRAHLAAALLAAGALSLSTRPAAAQLPSASASSLGLANNNTATVRGFGAISVNPAGLAMPGSGFSLAVAPVQVRDGLDPVTFADIFFDHGGREIPGATKERWLALVSQEGSESGPLGLDVTPLALTIGSFGIQVSTIGSATLSLPTGVAEAMLYGNAGRTGSATDLELANAAIQGFAATTVGVGYAVRVGSSSVGATAKYTRGHVMALGHSLSGAVETDPALLVTLDFPMVATCAEPAVSGCTQDFVDGGRGFGLDVGWMLDLPGLSLGASVTNLFNTFAWDTDKLGFRQGTALFEPGEVRTDFEELAYASAPAVLRVAVEAMKFEPRLQLGAALDLSSDLTVSADVHRRFGDGAMDVAPKTHAGVGAEFRGLRVLHLRGGFAAITGGVQLGGGASIVLGPVNLSSAVALRKGSLDDMTLLQLALSFGGR